MPAVRLVTAKLYHVACASSTNSYFGFFKDFRASSITEIYFMQ